MNYKRFLTIDWLRENLGLLLAVPTLTGGVWQVVSLITLGLPFVRFFSLSQLVADGILILIIISFIYLTFLVVWRAYGKPALEGDRTDFSKKEGITLIVIQVICISYFLYLCYGSVSDLTLKRQIGLGQLVVVAMAVAVAFLTCSYILKIAVLTFKLNPDPNRKIPSYISVPIGMSMVGMAFLFVFDIIPWLHRSFVSSSDLGNERYIDCAIQKRYPGRISNQIEYFNDNYIFVKVVRPDHEFIEVLKFDEFLDGEACYDIPVDSNFFTPTFPSPLEYR